MSLSVEVFRFPLLKAALDSVLTPVTLVGFSKPGTPSPPLGVDSDTSPLSLDVSYDLLADLTCTLLLERRWDLRPPCPFPATATFLFGFVLSHPTLLQADF